MYILLLFVCVSVFLNAQDSVYTFQPVEVISIRPVHNFQSYEILNKEEFNNVEALSLQKSFSKIPGLIINDRNNPSLGDKISIRGIGTRASFGVRGVKILMDEIPLTLPDGQSQTNNIDFYSIGKAEVLKGPASSFYGNSAGGVIKFQSEAPKSGILNIAPELVIGSFNFQKYSVKASGTADEHSYLISFSNLNFKGLRPHSSRELYLLNSFYRINLSDDTFLKVAVNYFNSPFLLNPGSLDKTALVRDRNSVREFNKEQGTGEKNSQLQGAVTLNCSTGDFSLEATTYIIKRDVLNPIPGRIIDLERFSGGFRSIASKKVVMKNLLIDLILGADIEVQNDFRKEFENLGLPEIDIEPEEIFENLNYGSKLIDQEENVFCTAPFFSIQMLLGKNFGFLGGIRFDQYLFKVEDSFTDNPGRRNMSSLSPGLGFFFKPSTGSKIYLNYSTSFQTPTTSELSNRPEAEGGFNNNLHPENIYQLELGSNYFFNNWNVSVSASLYYMSLSNLIIPYQVQSSEETFFRNAGGAENKGAEILIESVITEQLKSVLSYSIMDFKYKDYVLGRGEDFIQLAGNKVPGIPMQNLFFQVGYVNPAGISANINFSWFDKYYTNDFNGPPPGSTLPGENFINENFIKTDLSGAYHFPVRFVNVILFSGINNLFDIKYNGSVIPNAAGDRFFEPAPGRNWYAGIRIQY